MGVEHPTSPRQRGQTAGVTTKGGGKKTDGVTTAGGGKSSFATKGGHIKQPEITRTRGPGRTTGITKSSDGKTSFKRTA